MKTLEMLPGTEMLYECELSLLDYVTRRDEKGTVRTPDTRHV